MHHNHNTNYNNTTTRPSFMSRFGGRRRNEGYVEETTTTTTRRDNRAGVREGHHVNGVHFGTHGGTTAPVHHHKRHVSLGDKISGAMLKLRGSIEHRPGLKGAGTRRMHGTDGRGSKRNIF